MLFNDFCKLRKASNNEMINYFPLACFIREYIYKKTLKLYKNTLKLKVAESLSPTILHFIDGCCCMYLLINFMYKN